jgi:putrescine transport system substrate-binding protein
VVRDDAAEMVPVALAYLGLAPQSAAAADLDRVAALFAAVRPYVRFVDADVASGEVCVAAGFPAAHEAAGVAFSVPKEGAMLRFDMLAIPADAPDPEAAHAFIDFLLRPDVMAGVTDTTFRANANARAAGFVKPGILADPAIYPTAAVRARLFAQPVRGPRGDRALSRLWTRIHSGL